MKELKDLVADDKVVIKHKNDEGTIIYVATIERITRHYIYAIGVRFCKRNGKMIGEKSGSRTHIEIASEEVIKRMEEVIERKRLSSYLHDYDFFKRLSLEKLRKIIDIIKE